jgi:hypothetical protein
MPKPKKETELERFAKLFTREEWLKLCSHQKFLDLLLDDLAGAKALAASLLGKALQ